MFVRWQGEQEPTIEEQQTPAQRLLGDFAPKIVQLTNDVLFGDVWKRPGLSSRDRSLVTVAVLAATYQPDQLISHLRLALANGLTQDKLTEALTHLAFYPGWPSGMAALTQLKTITAETGSRRIQVRTLAITRTLGSNGPKVSVIGLGLHGAQPWLRPGSRTTRTASL